MKIVFRRFPKKNNVALQTRQGAMRHEGISYSIFSYDGTDRIRFTGTSYQAYSQPNAFGSPKMDLFCDLRLL